MEEKKIFKAIAGVMEDVGAVGKDRVNQKQNYRFRGIDDVMNALYPALVKNKVFVVPDVKSHVREERKSSNNNNIIYTILDVEYTFFCAEDGSGVVVNICGEGMDSGDKSMNKALSAAFKYACFQLFCIPTEEMHDSEEDSFSVQDRQITPEELKNLQVAAGRTGLNLDAYVKKYNTTADKLGFSTYTRLMIQMATRDSTHPITEHESKQIGAENNACTG